MTKASGIPTFSIAGADEPMLMFIEDNSDKYEDWLERIKETDDLPPIKPASEVTPIFYSAD